jgi:hypothetical protein
VGQLKYRNPFTVQGGVNVVLSYLSTAAIVAKRCVKNGAVAGTVKHTTGTSGRAVLGIALNSATGAGKLVWVQVAGIATVQASTRAIAAGAIVRATSGSVSASTWAGATVRTSTNAMTTGAPVRHNTVGIALTSAAAGAGSRTVSVLLAPTFNNPALL